MSYFDRRGVIKTAAAASLIPSGALLAGPANTHTAATRQFEVTTSVELTEADGANRLYLPVLQRASADQARIGLRWESDARVRIHRDRQTGAQVLYARWDETTLPRKLTLVEQVATWPRRAGKIAISAEQRALWTATSKAMPTDGIVGETARRIVGDLRDPKAKLRAIYDWVIANTWRDPATLGCGTGESAAMLQAHAQNGAPMGGKCADINSLMVCLCRAAGLPARDIFGIRLAASQRYKSLGREGNVTGAQHCRAEVWIDDEGWFAADPADVRKVVLEEKLPVDSDAVKQLTEDLFGGWEANWGGYNTANEIALPGATQASSFHFLMYPTAMGDQRASNSLDAANFRYRIESREITA